MQLGLTIPLQRFLRIKTLAYGDALETVYCWDLHKITLHGETSLLAVNCASRFTFVLYAMTAADWANLEALLCASIEQCLREAGMPCNAAAHYRACAGRPVLTKTHGRRVVAYLNRAWEEVLALDYTIDTTQQWQPLLNHAINRLPCHCAARVQKATAQEHLLALLSDSF